MSEITQSEVINNPEIDAAFSIARRVTFAGSITPVLKKFSNFLIWHYIHNLQNYLKWRL